MDTVETVVAWWLGFSLLIVLIVAKKTTQKD
jgi:hypothetical protein